MSASATQGGHNKPMLGLIMLLEMFYDIMLLEMFYDIIPHDVKIQFEGLVGNFL